MKAVFLDRDGTLIPDVGYPSSRDHIALIPEMVEVCRHLQHKGYALFVITNQSGVARGYFSERVVVELNDYLTHLFAQQGVVIQDCFYCPHHPKHGINAMYTRRCKCRKPAPGMLLQAAKQYGINLQQSIMIGDKQCDIDVGNAVGCTSYFVQDILKNPQGWLQKLSSDASKKELL